jgi:hypothetical protein
MIFRCFHSRVNEGSIVRPDLGLPIRMPNRAFEHLPRLASANMARLLGCIVLVHWNLLVPLRQQGYPRVPFPFPSLLLGSLTSAYFCAFRHALVPSGGAKLSCLARIRAWGIGIASVARIIWKRLKDGLLGMTS